jgi:hypothetical protein
MSPLRRSQARSSSLPRGHRQENADGGKRGVRKKAIAEMRVSCKLFSAGAFSGEVDTLRRIENASNQKLEHVLVGKVCTLFRNML